MRPAVLLLFLALVPARAQDPAHVAAPVAADPARVEAQLRAFGRLPAKEQERALQVVRDAVAPVAAPAPASTSGTAAVAVRSGGAARSGPKPVPRVAGKAALLERLRALLSGDASEGAIDLGDLRHGELSARLYAAVDTDGSVRSFAELLERWRDGDRSFYQALVQTAGRSEGVFHFDAMFAEWQQKCLPKGDPAVVGFRRSPDEAHRGFQRSFHAYWHYRSLREAFVATLLLDPDQHLPAALQRFEQAPAAGYSMRDCFVLWLALHRDDPHAAAEALALALPPLPARHWRDEDRVYAEFQAVFAAAVPLMMPLAPHTDQLLSATKERLRSRHQAMRAAAAAALDRELVRKR